MYLKPSPLIAILGAVVSLLIWNPNAIAQTPAAAESTARFELSSMGSIRHWLVAGPREKRPDRNEFVEFSKFYQELQVGEYYAFTEIVPAAARPFSP